MNSMGTSSTAAGQPSLKQPAGKGWVRRTGLLPWLLPLLAVAIVAAGLGWAGLSAPAQAQGTVDYDADDDGLIEVSNLAQLNAIRWDLDGDGSTTDTGYASAFPNPVSGMGCPSAGCTGYELEVDPDFDTNGNGEADSGDDYWNDGSGWVPIGTQSTRFSTTFDGNGHTISGLFINRASTRYVGLFGYIDSSSVIRNTGLLSVNVTGNEYVAGLAGRNSGDITASYASGSVTGDNYVGGLVGYNGGTITASYASGSVTGTNHVGGLVGRNSGGTITASYASGSVTGTGDNYVGGLVGRNSSGTITASYASGSVTGNNYVGGLVGFDNLGTITASYWDTGTSGQTTSAGGTGQTTSQLQSPTGYTGIYADWNVDIDNADADDDTSTGGDNPWDFGTASQYPTINSVPSAPATLSAVIGDGQVTLTWATGPSILPITKYQFQEDGSGRGWQDIAGSDATTTSHTVTGLTNGQSYTFEIRAVNPEGNGAASDQVSATPFTVPGAPRNVAAAPLDRSAQLTWEAPASDGGAPITGYEYQVTQPGSGEGVGWQTVSGSDVDTRSYEAPSLTNGRSYTLLVRAVNEAGPGADAAAPSVTPRTVPGNPQSFSAIPGDGAVDLSWVAALDHGAVITGYQYQQKEGDGNFGDWTDISDSAPGGTNAVSYTVTSLTNGVAYTFKLRAVNGSGDGAETGEVSATPAGLPLTPGGFTATGGDMSVILRWTVADDNGSPITKYQYQQKEDDSSFGSWTDISDSAPGGTNAVSYTVTSLTNGVAYTFRLRAVNGVGDGAETGEVSATPAGLPLTPGGFTATGGDMSVILRWTVADDNGSPITKYQYQQKEDDGSFGSWADISDSAPDGTNAVSYTVTGLTTGIVYTFNLRAVNDAGDGAETGEQTVTLPPAKPTGMTATAGHLQVTLAWRDPSDTTITGYQYQQTTATTTDAGSTVGDFSGLGWMDIPGANAGATSHIVTGLTNATTYYFRVRAGNPSGPGGATMYSSETDQVNATPLLGPPNAPTGLTATPSSTVTAVILSWNDPSDSAITGYQYRQTKTAMAVLTWTADSAATGWQYRHSVDYGDTYGDWMDIAVDDATTAATTTITDVNPHLDNQFEVSPVKSGEDLADVLTRQTLSGDFTDSSWDTMGGATATTVSHGVSGLDLNNNTYYFEVRWVKAGDVNGTVVVKERHVGSIDLTWDDPQDDTITRYQYELKENDSTPDTWKDIQASGFLGGRGTNATSYTIPDLKALVRTPSGGLVVLVDFVYTVKVRAVNQTVGDSPVDQLGAESEGVKANPGLAFDAPTGLEATWDFANGDIKLTWNGNIVFPDAQFEVAWLKDGLERSVLVDPTTGEEQVIVAATAHDIDTGGSFGDYQVRIRVRLDFGPWSDWTDYLDATATAFPEDTVTAVEVDDGLDIAALVGDPVAARMPTGFDLAYSISGGNGLFGIDAGTGQINVADALSAGEYVVTVTATYTEDRYPFDLASTDSVTVTINVTSAGRWRQSAKLTDSSASDDRYATAVAVNHYDLEETVGDATETVTHEVVAVGAPEDGSNDTGAVYLTVDGGAAIKLTSSTDNEKFGYSVALDGETLVVGTNSSTGTPGKVYVYTRPADGWSSSMTPAVLTDTDDSDGSHGFGRSVAISGNTIVVGAPDQGVTPEGTSEETSAVGAVYVYTKAADVDWATATEATAKLSRSGEPVADATFGAAVAVEGTAIIVGGPGESKVYFSAVITTDATAVPSSLSGPDGSRFGTSVALDSRNLVVGAPGEGPGVAYAYSGSGSSWGQPTRLTRSYAVDGEGFGASVAVSGRFIAVGRTSQSANDNAGSVKLYEKTGSRWVPFVLTADDPSTDATFGASVALSGETLIAGATGGNGAAYVMERIQAQGATGQEPTGDTGSQPVTPGDGTAVLPGVPTTVATPSGNLVLEIEAANPIQVSLNDDVAGCESPVAGGAIQSCVSVEIVASDGGSATGAVRSAELSIVVATGERIELYKRANAEASWERIPSCEDSPASECFAIAQNVGGGATITVRNIASFGQYVVVQLPASATTGGGTAILPGVPTTVETPSGNLVLEIEAANPIQVSLNDDVAGCESPVAGGAIQSCVSVEIVASDGGSATGAVRSAELSIVVATGERIELYKRANAEAPWERIPSCEDSPASECFAIAQNVGGGATITVRNITSFSQYVVVQLPASATTGGGTAILPGVPTTVETPSGNLVLEIEAANPIQVSLNDDVAGCESPVAGGAIQSCVSVEIVASDGGSATGAVRSAELSIAVAGTGERIALYKRASAEAPWERIPSCEDSPASECFTIAQYRSGGATITVRNIASFGQYVVVQLPAPVTPGGGTSAIVRRGRGGGAIVGVTATPAPAPTVIATPAPTQPAAQPTDAPQPTPVAPTATPTLAPTPVPSTAEAPTVVPTVVPPAPESTPVTVVAASPTSTPTSADTPEPVAAIPNTPVPAATTAVPPAVEPGGGFPLWLIAAIVVAVLVAGGLGFGAWRILRPQ